MPYFINRFCEIYYFPVSAKSDVAEKITCFCFSLPLYTVCVFVSRISLNLLARLWFKEKLLVLVHFWDFVNQMLCFSFNPG